MAKEASKLAQRWTRLRTRALDLWQYCYTDVWQDTRNTWKVNLVKTLNLSARSFMSADLQSQACAMTYRTLLAIVPALALLFAIGRGFGFQNLLQNQLYHMLPSQRNALETAIGFVDSYLNQATEGVFVGVGIVFLLWTLISLVGNVEDSFNSIWQVRHGRSIWRKITDYTAIFLILPVLMICAGGISILMSTTLRTLLPFNFLTPAITVLLDCASYVFTWLFFTGAYMLIPNTRVRFTNAFIAGIFTGTAFQILQWLFVSGQMYVSKYNAIYGSFSFLPLLLIWLQLAWLITLIGGVLCYASQNIGQFNFIEKVQNISLDYRRKMILAVMAIIAKRFDLGKEPLTTAEIANQYGLPVRLVTDIVVRLEQVGLVNFLAPPTENALHPVQPAENVTTLTISEIIRRLQTEGDSDFMPGFDRKFQAIEQIAGRITQAMIDVTDETTIVSLDIEI